MAFNIYDIDKNGKVDKKEMEKIIEAIYELKGQTNRNGIESPSEIVKKIMSRLGISFFKAIIIKTIFFV